MKTIIMMTNTVNIDYNNDKTKTTQTWANPQNPIQNKYKDQDEGWPAIPYYEQFE